MSQTRANDPLAWEMSLLELTDVDGADGGWYHLSVANPAWILRRLPIASEEVVADA